MSILGRTALAAVLEAQRWQRRLHWPMKTQCELCSFGGCPAANWGEPGLAPAD